MNILYKQTEQTIRQHEEILQVDETIQEEDIRHAIRWVMRDNPDIFWFVHQYHFDKDKRRVSFRYRCSRKRSAAIQKSIDDVVKNDFQIDYVRTFSQIEQVAYVYKWMLAYCNYNVNSAYNQNIDSVFVRRNSVCTGYAKAAQYLFKLLDIESRLVFGRLNNDKEEGRHCWNLVCIEGCYYHLDVCLGDLAIENVLKKAGATTIQRCGAYNYNCFCVSADEISITRSIEDAEALPLCNKTLPLNEVEKLSRIDIKERNGRIGCLLTHIGSSADIFLCTKDKNVVLKKFRGDDSRKCEEECRFMDYLRGCKHLLQLNYSYCDPRNNIIAVEQSTPIVDLFCSHYYHPTLYGVLTMIKDITLGWMECRQRGILYRDIHICNIYKANDGSYKLGDFGSCAYGHRALERVGNPWFMSPETYISGRFDERSAVYSITAVLYFILNGMRPPFVNGKNEEKALQRKMNGELLPEPALLPSFPKAIAELIMNRLVTNGCAYYPSERLRSCNELLQIIDLTRSTLKSQNIELQLALQDSEVVFDNKTLPNVYIPRDIHHRFAYGEEVERMAVSISDPMSDDIENYCRTMGIATCSGPENDASSSSVVADDKHKANYKKCKNGHYYNVSIYGEHCPFCIDPRRNNYSIGGNCDDYVNSYTSYCIIDDDKTQSDAISFVSNIRDNEQSSVQSSSNHRGFFSYFRRKRSLTYTVYSSIFAPAEVKPKSHMLVQVYLHLFNETETVKSLAQESDKNAERRDYIPLECKLKKGDKVDIQLNIYGETLLMSDKKSVVWQGSFTKCSFDYFVPKDIDVDELSCVTMLTVNGIPVGEMRFITRIVDVPRQLNPEVIAHKYNKVFISYSHQDESKVKFLHEGLELGSVPHFFDRKYLKAGDVFPQVIKDYINSADLFILCWSENASKSEYVQKERLQALERAFPQVKPEQEAKLRIYPLSIEPRAELPSDMKENYHFGEI